MSQRRPQIEATPHPGQILDVEGQDLDRQGRGLARWQSWVIVVPDLLPGEQARVQIQQRQRSHWLARRQTLTETSRFRRRPPCILAADCGGCSLQHLDDQAQLSWKQNTLIETMRRLGEFDAKSDPPIANLTRSIAYRNRALIPLRRDQNNVLRLGYYKRGSHRIINLNRCPVLDPRLDELINPLKQDLQDSGWPADHDLQMSGGLRHLGLRVGHHTGDLLITLVSSDRELPGLKGLATKWMDRWPKLRGVTLNLQPKRNNLILGTKTDLIAGSETIEEYICGQRLRLTSTTFFQINTPQAEAIIQVLTAWVDQMAPSGRVVDAYSGIGTISLPLAARGLQVHGIEVHPSSVKQARHNACLNSLEDRCSFEAGDVAERLADILSDAEALIVDPPRRGLEAKVIDTILGAPPKYFAYLSCDPATQARDLKELLEPKGIYRLQKLQPVDFFPQTTHLESLALMERIK